MITFAILIVSGGAAALALFIVDVHLGNFFDQRRASLRLEEKRLELEAKRLELEAKKLEQKKGE